MSSFGKVILNLQKIAERTASNYWKLKAIDSLRMSDNSNLSEVDYMKIIDILLDDVEIKDIYLHGDIFSNKNKPQEKDHKREVMLNTAR